MKKGNDRRDICLAFSCDHHGTIRHVIRQDIQTQYPLKKGNLFLSLFFIANADKAQSFLQTIVRDGAAFDWELNVSCTDMVRTLHFTGGRSDHEVVIVGSLEKMELLTLYHDLMLINNEQMNELRSALKELSLQNNPTERSEVQLYEELTKVNNEMLNLQRELSKKNIELERLNSEKNKFLGMAAHDLRNPLGAIYSYSEFLAEEAKGVLSAEHQEFVDIIHDSSQFMLNMVTELLDITSIESGRLVLDLQPVNMVELIRRNLKINRVMAEKKKIALEFTAETPTLQTSVDPMKINQVLNNLITNAVKFSFPDSTVHIGLDADEKELIVSIRDEGQGIQPHEVEQLFKPYTRISTKSTQGEKSTGLGLAIVKRIIQGHSGTISVRSEVGKGTVFTFRLPRTLEVIL